MVCGYLNMMHTTTQVPSGVSVLNLQLGTTFFLGLVVFFEGLHRFFWAVEIRLQGICLVFGSFFFLGGEEGCCILFCNVA